MAYCVKCGKELRPEDVFCVNCGAAIPFDLDPKDTADSNQNSSESTVFAQNTTENCADSFQRGMPQSDVRPEGLSLMQYFSKCYSHYADFSGKANRKELWGFALVSGLINAVLILAGVLVGNSVSAYGGLTLFILSGLYSLINVIPSLAVSVRRLHDTGRSGGWIFVSLIPFIGSIWLLVLFCTEGYYETSDRPASSAFKNQTITCIVLYIALIIAGVLVYDYLDNISRQYNTNYVYDHIHNTKEDKEIANAGSSNSSNNLVEKIFEEYSDVILSHYAEQVENREEIVYFIYDINEDGVPELIIDDRNMILGASRSYIYIFNNGHAERIKDFESGHTSLYSYNGNGIIFFSYSGGYGEVARYTLKNNSLSKAESYELSGYMEPYNYYSNISSMIGVSCTNAGSQFASDLYYEIDRMVDKKYDSENRSEAKNAVSSQAPTDDYSSIISHRSDSEIDDYIKSYVRPLFNAVKENPGDYSRSVIDGVVYLHDGKGYIKKEFMPGINNYNMKREYFYDTNSGRIAFAYVHNENVEHRLYFRTNQIVRYIGPDKITVNNPTDNEVLKMASYVLSEAY